VRGRGVQSERDIATPDQRIGGITKILDKRIYPTKAKELDADHKIIC
jgi:hypothetical protein